MKNQANNKQSNKSGYEDVCNKLPLAIGEANLYRDENYMVLDTVLHIVKCTQNNIVVKPTIYEKVTNPCPILNEFSYLLSIIEQYGYMMHYLYDSESKCNLSANKYYNRILDALTKICIIKLINLNQLKEKIDAIKLYKDLEELKQISDEILELKKIRSSDGNIEKLCYVTINETNYTKLQETLTRVNEIDLESELNKIIEQFIIFNEKYSHGEE